MRAISEGDLTKTIDKDYQGSFAEMKEYANDTVLKLSMIISEVNGAASQLDERVRAGEHHRADARRRPPASRPRASRRRAPPSKR